MRSAKHLHWLVGATGVSVLAMEIMPMRMISGLHFRFSITKKTFLFSLFGWFIGLFCLPQAAFSEVPSPEKGEKVYQAYCIGCHKIGERQPSGPDLKDVSSRREESWLVRWIVEPDQMLAEGDPIATQLKQEFNNIPMPNFGISEEQAKDVLAYIAVQSNPKLTQVATTDPHTSLSLPSQGQDIYQRICSACHTIGGGKKVGPDLTGATSRRDPEWLVRWIQEPDKMLAEGDSHAMQLKQEHGDFPMPNYGLSEEQAKGLITFIAAKSGDDLPTSLTQSGESEEKTPSVAKPAAPAGDFEMGKKLFEGQKPFENGGPACISCHTTSDVSGLGGGTLGPDLTKVNSRFGAITPPLVNVSFPTMRGVFSEKKILGEEATHLTAYFAKTQVKDEKPSMDFTISLISIGGFILLYILTHLIWRKRLTGVRIPLVGR